MEPDRSLIDATRPFAKETRWRSWLYVLTTFTALAALAAAALLVPWWPLRVAVSIGEGLFVVRAFVLFHDFLHGALLRGSPVASALFRAFGVVVMTPPRVWR